MGLLFSSITTELIERAQNGDRAAIQHFVKTLTGPIYNLALRMLLIHADAEEATQEALVRISTRLGSYRGESKFSTWAWTVATRCILDFRGSREPMMSFQAFSDDLAVGTDVQAQEHADDALKLQQLKLGCGRALLQCLDVEHRVAYVLGEILAFPGDEAAAILGIPHATYRKRTSRARERVREALMSNCGIVNDDAPCLCHRRLERAQELGRLAPADAGTLVDVSALRRKVHAIDELARDVEFYRADPEAFPVGTFVTRVVDLVATA